ncbi:MAG: hypothetical protein WDM71_00020 [Ferruginibacter sp.]
MRIYTVLVLVLIFCFGVKAQSPVETIKLGDSLLKSGDYKACIVVYEFPDTIKRLQEKAIKSLDKNPKLADKFLAKFVSTGTVGMLRYSSDYGLTKGEYDSMIAGFRIRKKAILKDTLDISIKKENGIITFNAKGKLAAFNKLSIHINTSKIIYDNDLLTREGAIQGGQIYAPILYGYEVSWPVPVENKKTNYYDGASSFSIGKNKDDDRVTLALLFQSNLPRKEPIVITILN